MPNTIRTVAIIGAGPSGLAAAKYLLEEDFFSNIVIYEQRRNVGGVWNYTPLPSNPPSQRKSHPTAQPIDIVTRGLPKFNTPMYEELETNLPHMLMQFSDTPFPAGTQLFPSREKVLQYLEEYAEAIAHLIRFDQSVVDVRPRKGEDNRGWEVTTKDLSNGSSAVESFDAVIAANGHCDWPLLPPIQGLDAWGKSYPESLHHSVSYKNAGRFADKRVLLVGGGPSGADISQQIAAHCKPPLLRSQIKKSPYHTSAPNIRDLPGLVALLASDRSAKFADGSTERDIDEVILCTGYAYSFPFLSALHPDIQTEGIRPLPLYRNIFHAQFPTLAFIETPEMIVPFPLAESQAAVVARVLAGRLPLPDRRGMEEWCEKTRSERGDGGRGFHALEPPRDLQYMKDLYSWVCEAEREVAREKKSSSRGKMPREWDPRACWLRMNAAEMRKAFAGKGDGRCDISSYEELGFGFVEA
ncbi:MAG: hypothetical protein LQ345_004572 [Seirophora villosa]|nr:MAG: hypothetical protein LQ345_004572 [Seirophora villosa]